MVFMVLLTFVNLLFKRIHEERWKQIIDRKEKLLQEKNDKINEIIEANKAYAYNACLERELIRKNKNLRRQYGHELRAQWNYEKRQKVSKKEVRLKLLYVLQNVTIILKNLIRIQMCRKQGCISDALFQFTHYC